MMELEIQARYDQVKDCKTLVLFKVGCFYEIYGYDKIGHIIEAANKCNSTIMVKYRTKFLSMDNPLLFGFPFLCYDKYCTILNNFKLVIVDNIKQEHVKVFYDLNKYKIIALKYILSSELYDVIPTIVINMYNNIID